MANVRMVGHCSTKPSRIRMKPAYWGCRTRAYGPAMASSPWRWAVYSTSQARAMMMKPPPMKTLLTRCSAFRCESPSQPSSVPQRCPALWVKGSSPG